MSAVWEQRVVHICGHKEEAKAKGHLLFYGGELLADEKDCHKVLTFLTYCLIDFRGSAKHVLNWLTSETK